MGAKAKKVETRGMSPKERYDILEKFKKLRDEGKTNVVAAAQVGVPFITLYSWLRDKLWRDAKHTKPPIRLTKRAKRGGPKPGRRAKAVEESKPKTILRKAPGNKKRLKNYTPVDQQKVELPKEPKAASQPKPVPFAAGKPIIVRLPNGVEVEFADLDAAREFAQSCNK
jgi:hypothetical protein